jgi:hypothetical protein
LSSRARSARDAILTAREPDELIFNALPEALEAEALGVKAGTNQAEFAMFSKQIEAALVELDGAYSALLNRCQRSIATELHLGHEELPGLRAALKERAYGLADTLLEPRLRSFVLLAINDQLDDEAWLEAVLNNVAGRPAAGWRDVDTEHFMVELHGLGGTFRRYQALHYEALARNSDGGFDGRRITVTTPDGSEFSAVVWVDEEARPPLEQVAARALAEAQGLLGERGGEALLALVAGIVGTAKHHETVDAAPTTPQRKAHDAQ